MSTRTSPLLKLIITVGALACILGDGPTTKPATAPATQPTTRSTQAATIEDIDKAYVAKVRGLQMERADAIRGLLQQAMERKDLDAAIALRERLKSAEQDVASAQESDARPEEQSELRTAIKDISWRFGLETIKFKSDGTVQQPGWDGRGLKTTWQIIDRRTILMHLDAGRDFNRTALFIYSPKFVRYRYWDFEGRLHDWEAVVRKD